MKSPNIIKTPRRITRPIVGNISCFRGGVNLNLYDSYRLRTLIFILTKSVIYKVTITMLSRDDFNDLARLARLDPDDKTLSGLMDDFNQILDYVEKIKELDTAQVQDYYTAIDTHNVTREDERKSPLTPEDISGVAPEWEAGHFVVPRVIETE